MRDGVTRDAAPPAAGLPPPPLGAWARPHAWRCRRVPAARCTSMVPIARLSSACASVPPATTPVAGDAAVAAGIRPVQTKVGGASQPASPYIPVASPCATGRVCRARTPQCPPSTWHQRSHACVVQTLIHSSAGSSCPFPAPAPLCSTQCAMRCSRGAVAKHAQGGTVVVTRTDCRLCHGWAGGLGPRLGGKGRMAGALRSPHPHSGAVQKRELPSLLLLLLLPYDSPR